MPTGYTADVGDGTITEFAPFALRTYTGELLRRALAVSQALVEFEIMLEKGEDTRPAGA